jgi:hypothetical protein
MRGVSSRYLLHPILREEWIMGVQPPAEYGLLVEPNQPSPTLSRARVRRASTPKNKVDINARRTRVIGVA